MRRLPTGTDRDEFHALVVRTDHDSEQAWQAVIAELMQPWGDRDYEPLVHFVDDPAWAGATADEVLVAAAADEDLCVVFVADSVTMGSAHHGLLAVTTVPAEEYENLEEYEELRELDGSSARSRLLRPRHPREPVDRQPGLRGLRGCGP